MYLVLSKDPEVLNSANRDDYVMAPSNEEWLKVPGNLMYRYGEDVGLATYDYPGLYSVHWFFRSKGKEALKVTALMLDDLFTHHGAKVVRGVIHMDNKPARFLAKYLGFERISIEEFPDGPNELILLPKEVFHQVKEKLNEPR